MLFSPTINVELVVETLFFRKYQPITLNNTHKIQLTDTYMKHRAARHNLCRSYYDAKKNH